MGSYTIGKERVAGAIATALESQIRVSETKMDVLRCFDASLYPIVERLTHDASAQVILANMASIRQDVLATLLKEHKESGRFSKIIGMKCTVGIYTILLI